MLQRREKEQWGLEFGEGPKEGDDDSRNENTNCVWVWGAGVNRVSFFLLNVSGQFRCSVKWAGLA